MNNYEVEIKVLLTTKENCEKFKENISRKLIGLEFLGKNSQLNHYFTGGDFNKLKERIFPIIPSDKQESFDHILKASGNYSFRTRFLNGDSILVIKLAIDNTTSSNGISRLEWECIFKDMKIEDLDKILLDSEFKYQAKWSREREEYKTKSNITITIDKNAGYGYLSEFEMVVGNKEDAVKAEENIRKLLKELGLEELSQDRIERMFKYYNENWKDYYGTEKYFVIK